MANHPQSATEQEALELIDNASLPHPSACLLGAFVYDALNPDAAANYILKACHGNADSQAVLHALVSDWKYIVDSFSQQAGVLPAAPDEGVRAAIVRRDGNRCCITGKKGTLWDPLVVAPILPIPTRWLDCEPRIFNMLSAFFGPPYRDWWLGHCEEPDSTNPYHSHWLVRTSAAAAFAQGLVVMDRLHPSFVEYKIRYVPIGTLEQPIDVDGLYPLLGDQSRSHIAKVDARFVGTQARIAPSIRWLDLASQFAKDSQVSESAHTAQKTTATRRGHAPPLVALFQNVFLRAWLMLPARARMTVYKTLANVGHRLYGSSGGALTQRLPFGLYLKSNSDLDSLRNEARAMDLARRYTSIPVPRPLDIASIPAGRTETIFDDSHDDAYLLMTRVPGIPLARVQEDMSDKDVAGFSSQMRDYITQLRAIPKSVSPEFSICSTLGGPIRDTRIRDGDPVGPYVGEAAFNHYLRNRDDPGRTGHAVVFTHADLNHRNILVDQETLPGGGKRWAVSGIVDWEFAGYYPEYWEYTKSLFEGRFRYSRRWVSIVHELFKPFGDYSREFEVENRSWEEGI